MSVVMYVLELICACPHSPQHLELLCFNESVCIAFVIIIVRCVWCHLQTVREVKEVFMTLYCINCESAALRENNPLKGLQAPCKCFHVPCRQFSDNSNNDNKDYFYYAYLPCKVGAQSSL